MNTFRGDLHIHSVLSPCGDLEMSPSRIVDRAYSLGLDMIAITDHNHTGHVRLARELGQRKGIWVVYGTELTTREEVHCLAFFDTDEQVCDFQSLMEARQPRLAHDPELFGPQVIVDENEQILEQVSHSLYPALDLGISEVAKEVGELGGLFVPAHIDRNMFGLYKQLGFLPEDLQADAMEISKSKSRNRMYGKYPELKPYRLIKNSDAHFPEDIGSASTLYRMKEKSFRELCLAMRGEKGRGIEEDNL